MKGAYMAGSEVDGSDSAPYTAGQGRELPSARLVTEPARKP